MQIEVEEPVPPRRPAHQGNAGGASNKEGERAAEQNEQRVFHNDLAEQAPPACAEGDTNAQFPLARAQPRDLKIGQVEAAHQEDQHGQDHE